MDQLRTAAPPAGKKIKKKSGVLHARGEKVGVCGGERKPRGFLVVNVLGLGSWDLGVNVLGGLKSANWRMCWGWGLEDYVIGGECGWGLISGFSWA